MSADSSERPLANLQMEPVAPGRSASRVWIILRKEFRELFRDRRTVISVIVSPLIITPALFAILGSVISGEAQKARTQVLNVGLVGGSHAPSVAAALTATTGLRVEQLASGVAAARVKSRSVAAVAIVPADAGTLMARGTSVPITILDDPGNETSQSGATRLHFVFGELGRRVVARRLERERLPAEYADPFRITDEAIPQGGSEGTFMLAMMLPYILAVSAFSGAIYAAFDQVAGEKERGTLETLLVSPASRADIVIGKFGAVVAVCLISSILSIVGMIIPFVSGLAAFSWIAKGGLRLSPSAIGVTVLVMLPLAVLFAGLLLAVSTFARNQKEAQTYLAPLFLAVLAPAMVSMFLNADNIGIGIALVPVLNASIIVKQALSGAFNPAFIVTAFAASIVYAGLALTFATSLFQRESILLKA